MSRVLDAFSTLFEGPAGGFLEALFTASWKGGLVVLVVLAVQALLGRRLPPRWRYALWLLVAVRLLLPVGPPSPLSLFRLAGPAGSGAPLATPVGSAAGGGAAAALPAPGPAPGLAEVLLGVWALGVVVIAARALASDRRLRALLAAAEPVTDPAALELLDRCRGRIGVRRPVRLASTPALPAPALSPGSPWPGSARGTAAILLPSGARRRWTADELRYVLLHELAHLHQGDGAARRLASLLTALHWFNPLVHVAARCARADREPACDALVLARLGGGERAGYGRALIRSAERVRTHRPLPGLVGMADHGHQLRRRITMIADDRPTPPRHAAVLTALALLLAIAAWTDVRALAGPPPAADAAPAADPSDHEKQAVSLQHCREVGVAMHAWLTDVRAAAPNAEEATGEDSWGESADWSNCPPISYDELSKLLVGTYVHELPRADGWGHRLEYCLDRDPAGRYVIGVRSPGRDGRWQGDVYPISGFAPEEVDRDLVWIDGFFITWPRKAGE